MTRLKSHTLPMLLLFVVMTYMLFGFGYTGIIGMTQLQPITLGILLAGAIFAAVQHLHARWQFYRSPLTIMLVPWVVAILVATLANPHVWRISLESIGFVGIFIGVMAFFAGAIANRAITRAAIEEAFLLFGFVMMVIGYIQWGIFLQHGGYIPRMGSLFGNPNFYGMFLLIVIMLALHRLLVTRQWLVRLPMALYVLAALLQLVLSGSRGGQIGLLMASGTYAFLWMFTPAEQDALSPYARLNTSFRARLGFSIGWLMAIVLMVGVALVSVIALSRGMEARFDLWSAAIHLFEQAPLTGNGLYSYAERSMAFRSVPPQEALVHAHSIVFQVMADLGILGLIALAVSIVIGVNAIRANRRRIAGPSLRAYDALVAILVGLSVHQLVDMATLFMALLVLVIVMMVITPIEPQPMRSKTGRRVVAGLLILLTVGVAAGAFWRINLYTAYINILAKANEQTREGEPIDYAAILPELNTLVQADPDNRVYRFQYAVWAGQLAYQTDVPADIQRAIAAHEAVTDLMPDYGLAWSNLSALYWQLGDLGAAAAAAESGRAVAPQWALLNWQLAAVARDRHFPLPIERVLVWFSRSNIQLVYLYDVLDPLLLPQVVDQFVWNRDDDLVTVTNRLLWLLASVR